MQYKFQTLPKKLFLGKSARLSSVYTDPLGVYSYEGDKAVDGIYNISDWLKSLANSQLESRPWWRVDLGDVHCVWAVNILNRFASKLNYSIGITIKVYSENICHYLPWPKNSLVKAKFASTLI